MTMLNKFWRTLSLNDKKWNGFVLVAIVFLSGFIGIYGIIIPSLLNGPLDKDSPLDRESESNLGYEEMIRVNIDRYGNLTVHGSFQGPQVTPNVNWALPEYDAIYMLQLDVVNPNTSSSFYKTEIQALNPVLSRNDVYLHIFFLIDVNSFLTQGMAHPFAPNPSQRLQIAATVKNDLEQAFGISNNFTANPIGDGLYWDQLKVLLMLSISLLKSIMIIFSNILRIIPLQAWLIPSPWLDSEILIHGSIGRIHPFGLHGLRRFQLFHAFP